MMKLIMEQSLQIKQMETMMEKMVQKKEKVAQLAITTMQALPLIAIPTTTLETTNTGIGSSTEQLARSMESMNLQTKEIKRLETQVNIL